MTPKKATDTEAVKIQIDRLTLANTRLVAQKAALNEELKFAKASLIKIAADYEARVKNTLKMDIQDVLGCSDMELHKLTDGKKIEDLEAMFHNFVTATDAVKSPYDKTKIKTASIRPGASGVASVPGSENLTVGNLFGKSREEIRKMGGEM